MRTPRPLLHILLATSLIATASGQPGGAGYERVTPEEKALIETLEAGMINSPAPVPWRLFVPKEARTDNRLPLVVFLHGAGKRGTDNVGPMSLAWRFITPEAQAKNPCFVLAPQVRLGRRWSGHAFKENTYDSTETPITPEMQATLALVEELIAGRPIDPKRVYVTGQSMGGYGTWEALIRRPDLWAAAVPICGAGDPSKAATIKDIPIWAWHGEKDTMVPVEGSRLMVSAIEKAGGKPKYSEIKGGGHGVWNPAYADPELHRWLFEQRRPE